MARTTVPSEQLEFRSSVTGNVSLDTYLQNAEIGGLTLAELLNQIFDTSGNPVISGLANWTGDWTTATSYQPGDTFSDPATGNIYVALTSHTSTNIASDTSNSDIEKAIDVGTILTDAQAYADAALTSSTTASTQAGIATTKAAEAAASAASFDTTLYLKRDGTQAPTAALNMNSQNITNAATVNATAFVGDGSGLTGVTDASLLARIETLETNLAINTLRDIIDGGWTILNMADGFSDAFTDETGVDTATSINEDYDGAGNYYHNPTLSLIASATPIGTLTSNGGLAAAFDGTTTQAVSASARGPGGTSGGYIGQNWGTNRTITGFRLTGTSDHGFIDTGAGNVTCHLYGSTDNFSGSNVLLGSTTATADANGLVIEKFTGITTTTAYQYHRIHISHTNGTEGTAVAEVEFYEGGAAADMALVSIAATAIAAPTAARAIIILQPVDAITLNTDVIVSISRDNGATYTAGTLTLEASYDGTSNIYATDEIDLTAQPSGTDVRIKLETANNKEVRLHGWASQWR
jgi:hypothetical protein